MSNMARLGRRLRALRESADMTQMELSRATGISQNYISSLELGRIASPSMELLCTIGARFGLTPNDIAVLAEWWKPPRTEPKFPTELNWSIERWMELPKSDKTMVATVLRQMVSASYRDARGHAPPPELESPL